jgi:hypothetical protein
MGAFMRPRDWFSVGARLFGLWVFYQGVGDLLSAGSWALNILPSQLADKFGDLDSTIPFNLWYAAGDFLFALYLIFGAEHLTRWVFNETQKDDSGEDDRLD